VRFLICASNDFLKKFGRPKKPTDLVNFNCLINEKQIRPDEWCFREGNKDMTVKVSGNLLVNDSIVLHDAVLHGMGIARLPDYHVTSDVRRGGICVLFDNVVYDTRTITAAYPRTKFMPLRVKAFLDFLDDFIAAGKPILA
jgi:DNA-binding transcriptional LysR family regulator